MSFLNKQPAIKTIATRDLEDEDTQKAAREMRDRVRPIRAETLLTQGAIPSAGAPRRALLGAGA